MRAFILTALLVGMPLRVGTAGTATPEPPTLGAIAPDFSLPYATRDSVSSSKLTLSVEVKKGPKTRAARPPDTLASFAVCSVYSVRGGA